MTLDVFGKAAIFCNSERKIMENWAFSWNRIMGSALDKIKKKKNLRMIVWKGRRVKYNAKADSDFQLKTFSFQLKRSTLFPS